MTPEGYAGAATRGNTFATKNTFSCALEGFLERDASANETVVESRPEAPHELLDGRHGHDLEAQPTQTASTRRTSAVNNPKASWIASLLLKRLSRSPRQLTPRCLTSCSLGVLAAGGRSARSTRPSLDGAPSPS